TGVRAAFTTNVVRMIGTGLQTQHFDAEVIVLRVRYVSDQTGWAVLDAAADDGEEVVLVGSLGHLEQRERARVVGSWIDDSRYGPQVKVTEANPLPPDDEESVALYLKRVKHVGAKRAARLIEHFGASGALEAVDADPHGAFRAAGLTGRAIQEAIASWERLRSSRRLHLMLAPHGLAYLVARIQEAYGEGAYRVVAERPYELTSVFGVGFLLADRIARGAGLATDDPERARAGALHLLTEAERGGSSCPASAMRSSTASRWSRAARAPARPHRSERLPRPRPGRARACCWVRPPAGPRSG